MTPFEIVMEQKDKEIARLQATVDELYDAILMVNPYPNHQPCIWCDRPYIDFHLDECINERARKARR